MPSCSSQAKDPALLWINVISAGQRLPGCEVAAIGLIIERKCRLPIAHDVIGGNALGLQKFSIGIAPGMVDNVLNREGAARGFRLLIAWVE